MTSDRDRWDARHMAADDVDPPPAALLFEFEGLLPPPGRALDIACGRGRNAVWLAVRGFWVDAIDVSSIGLAKAMSLVARYGVADSVRTIEHDLVGGLPALDGPYDVVMCLHYRDPALWPKLPALVAPGGLLLVETLARDVTNLDVNPDHFSERDELPAAATGLEIVFQGRAAAGKRTTDRLVARRVR